MTRNVGAAAPPQPIPNRLAWGIPINLVVLGHLAEILDATAKLSDWAFRMIVFDWHGAKYMPMALAALGYVGLAYLFYRWLRVKRPQWRASVTTVTSVAPIFLLSLFGFARFTPGETPASVWKRTLVHAADRFKGAEVSTGGFRFDPSYASDTQVYTTAQAIAALLAYNQASVTDHDRIRKHFDYIERQPRPDGWGYFENSQWSVTEISGWVAVAYAKALGSHVWSGDERLAKEARLQQILAEIVRRQDPQSGLFSPAPALEVTPLPVRTYSSVVALWALIEARAILPSFDHDDPISRGVTGLLNKYRDGRGWAANPSPPRQNTPEVFPGLTAQAFFVLARVHEVSPHLVHQKTRLQQVWSDFVRERSVDVSPLHVNSRIPDSDVHLRPSHYMLESSTYLWFPWSVAALGRIEAAEGVPDDVRVAANKSRMKLLGRYKEAEQHYQFALTYELAEHLFCLSQEVQ